MGLGYPVFVVTRDCYKGAIRCRIGAIHAVAKMSDMLEDIVLNVIYSVAAA